MTQLDFRLLFERVPARFLVLAPEPSRYTILGASDAYLDATWTTREIVSRALFEVFPDNPTQPHANGVQNLDSSLQRALARRANDVMAVQHYDIRDRSGQFVERHWSPANAPVMSGDGTLVALIHRVEDVTEFVRDGLVFAGHAARLEQEILLSAKELAAANAALHESAMLRQRINAIVSHDLRTPLSAIQNAAHMLARMVAKLEAPPLRIITLLQSSAARMAALLNDLDDYAATQLDGRLSISRERLNVRALCEKASEEARLAYPTRQVELTPGENIAADVDPRRFQQMLQNLLGNALTYGAPDRPVRVSLLRSFGYCIATVSNEGDPIPEGIIPLLFQPFRRGPRTGDVRHRGHMGLGLFIVQQIALAHGGDVHVESSPQGTHFSVHIPVKQSY